LIDFELTQKKGKGSLHPQPEGWGIRDPPHSLCNKITESFNDTWDASEAIH